jgi:hypothetical protein
VTPEDVANDLVNLAIMVRLEHNPDGSREELVRFLAAVLPAHEAMVRAKVAAELHARADAGVPGTGFKRGLRAAAHHANPTTIEDAARALQAMYERDIARGDL